MWSLKCKLWSVECKVRRHVGAKKRAFRARRPPILIFSTRYQAGWNVTKCHACHAKRHDNLLGHIRIGDVFQLPP